MRNWILPGLFLLFNFLLNAQDAGYQKPPKQIQDLVEAPLTPAVRLSPDGKFLLLLAQPGYPTIAELAQPELRLAGLRINPSIHGGSRVSGYTGIELIRLLLSHKQIEIKELIADSNAGKEIAEIYPHLLPFALPRLKKIEEVNFSEIDFLLNKNEKYELYNFKNDPLKSLRYLVYRYKYVG
jgi:hypothetical protein